ncbi:hypothetical protein V1517DRAFT_306691 [Lipomyces orientalis]|uniref:Uncharacterized protein n=1 Tax=Lipomyces orientalis TaxID=1233043 RepID=A0ACC3TSI2_9ASCO
MALSKWRSNLRRHESSGSTCISLLTIILRSFAIVLEPIDPLEATSPGMAQQQLVAPAPGLIDPETGAGSLASNIHGPPPAYLPARQRQLDLEANILPPYEAARDGPAYTDNVPLQNLRRVDGLSRQATAASDYTNDDGTFYENSKQRRSVWDATTTKKGMVTTLAIFFAISAVFTVIGLTPMMVKASKN